MPRQYHVRRANRELTEPEALADVLRRGKYATIAMVHDGEPYLVTLSYGWHEAANALFFHMATAGRKIDALAADPRVCATVVIDGGYVPGKCEHRYESVVMTGTMRVLTDPEERRAGMRVLIGALEKDPAALWSKHELDGDEVYERMNVARLDIETITGKAGS
jgi:nitroimidazol reductase NimA-like FMN-containing flavoprotein (pyridoxamine 5'-phosphate oxidase superfamily)